MYRRHVTWIETAYLSAIYTQISVSTWTYDLSKSMLVCIIKTINYFESRNTPSAYKSNNSHIWNSISIKYHISEMILNVTLITTEI